MAEYRPLMWNKIDQLEEFFELHSSDPGKLAVLFEELGHRRDRMRPRALREAAVARLRELVIAGEYFPWPSTFVEIGGVRHSLAADWRHEGVLRFLGYRVGVHGQRPAERRELLDFAFQSPLPRLQDADYMEELSRPRTAKRLRKLANIIAALARNAKRRRLPALARSIADWEADLEYLRVKYYVGRFDFPWPRP